MTPPIVIVVTVAYAAPGVEALVPLSLPVGATVADAVAASGLLARDAQACADIAFAIHGQGADPAIPLRDGDRVEITRRLVVDPKDARRTRAADKPLPRAPKPKKRRTAGRDA